MTPAQRRAQQRKQQQRRKDLRDIGLAAGAVGGTVWGRGVAQSAGRARVLRAMSKPGNQIARQVNMPDVGWNTHRKAYKAMYPTVNRWVNTFGGAGKIRRAEAAGAKTGALRTLARPYRTRSAYDAKILGRAVDAAPKRDVLYRGVGLPRGGQPRPMPGLTSWTKSMGTASSFAHGAVGHAKKGKLAAKLRNTTVDARDAAVLQARDQRGFRLAPFSDRIAELGDGEIEYLVKPGSNFRRMY